MIYRGFGAAFLILFGVTQLGFASIPEWLIGACALVAGFGLAAGV